MDERYYRLVLAITDITNAGEELKADVLRARESLTLDEWEEALLLAKPEDRARVERIRYEYYTPKMRRGLVDAAVALRGKNRIGPRSKMNEWTVAALSWLRSHGSYAMRGFVQGARSVCANDEERQALDELVGKCQRRAG